MRWVGFFWRFGAEWPLPVTLIAVLLAGCSPAGNAESRPFFQHEYDLNTHGRKTLLDRVIETDPGSFHVKVAKEFLHVPPARIAVLPFADIGRANFVVDKIALTHHNRQQRYDWAWTDGQRLRRSMQGFLAQREFGLANLLGIDAVLKDRGVRDERQLERIPPQELGRWLGVDAVMYGTVLSYQAYYLGLIAAWQVGIEVRLVSTHTGDTLIEATGSRWDDQVLPAIDVQDILINSLQNVLQLRDINLARAEEEACREIVMRIPVSEQLEESVEQGALARSLETPEDGDLPTASFLPPR